MGKTSLLARLLALPEMARTGVVVNEFGSFGVDDLLLASAAPRAQMALLRNGCLCCRPGNDLSEAIRKMIAAAPEPLMRIVVETSAWPSFLPCWRGSVPIICSAGSSGWTQPWPSVDATDPEAALAETHRLRRPDRADETDLVSKDVAHG